VRSGIQPIEAGRFAGVCAGPKSGEALPHAYVWITGTNVGTLTSTDGYFILVERPCDTLSLSVRYIGYRPVDIRFVHRPGGEPLRLQLDPMPQRWAVSQ